jgi:hypothetical protein
MRKKLMLEALAAWLALAAASGQACASIQQTGDKSGLTMVTNPVTSLDEITTPHSDGKVPANSVRANADVALLTSAAVRKGTRLTTGVHAPARSPFRVDAPQSNATLGFSPSGAVDFAPGRKNGYDAEFKRRAVLSHDAVSALQPQGVLVAANAGSGQIKAIQNVRPGDLDPEKFYLIANAKLAPGPTVPVPEPGNWATVLAGLLGVIAIARRRMSLQ